VRAALDLLRQNQTAAQNEAAVCAEVLKQTSFVLQCLDPEGGDEELIKAVAGAQTKLPFGPFCGKFVNAGLYRVTSLIRNSPPPYDHHRALSIDLL